MMNSDGKKSSFIKANYIIMLKLNYFLYSNYNYFLSALGWAQDFGPVSGFLIFSVWWSSKRGANAPR